MNTSALKYKIVLCKPVSTGSDYSTNNKISYSDYKTVWAGVTYIGGNKNIQNYEMFASQSVQFQIRYRTDFDENFKVRFNNKYYSILNIKELGYKDGVVITADLEQD